MARRAWAMAGPKRESWALLALLALHVALGVYYSVAIPIWEAHDEDGHYYFVRHLATERRLPRPGERSISTNDEMHQPPLYYILAALPVSLIDVDDGLLPHYNPHMPWPRAQGGQNRVVHDPALERWPYRGTVLAVHAARWVSVLLGALGVLFTFWAARALAPGEPWVRWGAALTLTFWPQYRFASAVINNDLMVTVCAAAVTWLVAQAATAPGPAGLLGLCLAGGLALLAKGNGLALLPAVVLGLLVALAGAPRGRRLRVLAALLPALALGAVAVGWWYAHNLQAGAGLLGGRRTLQLLSQTLSRGLRGGRLGWGTTAHLLRSGLFGLWATFGWGNVGLPLPTYWLAGAWAALGLLGLGRSCLGRLVPRRAVGAALVGLVALSVVGSGLVFAAASGQKDLAGRYLLPALPALTVLLALGWSVLLPGPARGRGWALMGGGLGLLALLTPALYIGPAYAAPRPLTEAQLAAYTPAHLSFGGFAELVGYRIEEPFVDPGATLRLSLAWRVLARAPADYTLAVQVFAPERRLLGEVHRFPGRGALATSTWQPGTLFAEEVSIPLREAAREGRQAWLEVSFYDHTDVGRPLALRDARGEPLGSGARLGRLKVRGTAPALAAPPAASYRFGPAIRLLAAQAAARSAGGAHWLDLDLYWARDAGSAPGGVERGATLADYTVSVQLRDAGQAIVAQADNWPRHGAYPTSLWEPGEVVRDHYTLFLPADLAAGSYGLYACLYDVSTLERLPAADPTGQGLANSELPLATLAVGANPGPALQAGCALLGVPSPPAGSGVAQPPPLAADYGPTGADAVVGGLSATDQALAAGKSEPALRILRRDVLSQDHHSLPGLYRRLRAEEALLADGAPRLPVRTLERLVYFNLQSVAIPADGRLALHLGQAMADLVEAGLWSRETLLNVLSYQVWRFAEGERGLAAGRMLEALEARFPRDPDLGFYRAELHHRRAELNEAEVWYGAALALDPAYAQAYLRLGLVAEAGERLPEAERWYREYRGLAPGDLLGLKKLAELATALGRPEAASLQEALAERTDDRRIVARLLGVPVEAVELGPNLVANGGFEEWWGEQPVWWAWYCRANRWPYARAAIGKGPDGLSAVDGERSARVDELWLRCWPTGRPAPAGFWHRKAGRQEPQRVELEAGAPYLVSLYYTTAPGADPNATLWLTPDKDVLWRGDRSLPATAGAWRRFVAVGWNRSADATEVRPLVRAYAAGSMQFDGFRVHRVQLMREPGMAPVETQFLLSPADG